VDCPVCHIEGLLSEQELVERRVRRPCLGIDGFFGGGLPGPLSNKLLVETCNLNFLRKYLDFLKSLNVR
jgi:hypothetical protein